MAGNLAIKGGTPVRTRPMPGWPAPGDEEIEAAAAVLRSGRLNYWTGDQGRAFELEYRESLGRAHGLAVANGTLALELALKAFGVGEGDEVIVPSRTFIATASAVVAVGATPVCADIEPDSGNLSARTTADVMSSRTRGIIPVHLGGWPVDMDPINALAQERNLIVIEDCAQAHGASYCGKQVGGLGSHAAAFSFCQDKIVPIGEGGMLVLDDDNAYERAWAYRDHGKSFRAVADIQASGDGTSFRWLVEEFGSNWRLVETSSAVGRVGLRQLPAWHEARTLNANALVEAFEGISALRVPLPAAEHEHAFYRLYGYVEPDALASGWDRDSIARAIAAEGVPCQYGTCAEIYREQAFTAAGLGPAGRLPGAARAHDTSLAFFVHPTLAESDIADTIAAVHKVMEVASL